jgi:hypothetical protein
MATALAMVMLTASGLGFLTRYVFLAVPLILVAFIVWRDDPRADARRIGGGIMKLLGVIVAGLAAVAVPLGMLYLLVRLVKWAWTN